MRYLLDTNVILRHPSVLENRARMELAVTDVVLEEVRRFAERQSATAYLLDAIRQAERDGLIIIEPTGSEIDERLRGAARISTGDALQISHALRSPVAISLVTNDLQMLRVAREFGVNGINYSDFHAHVEAEALAGASQGSESVGESARKYKVKSIVGTAFSGGFGAILGGAVTVFIKKLDYILNVARSVEQRYMLAAGSVMFLLCFGLFLFWLRGRRPVIYGVAEIVVGVAAGLSTLLVENGVIKETFSDIANPATAIQLLGGVYIIVRGLDNVGKGIKGTWLHPYWGGLFKEAGK